MKKFICYLKGHIWQIVEPVKHDPKIAYSWYLYMKHKFCERCGKQEIIT